MSESDSEAKAAAVPEWVKQVEEIRGRWPWVERSIWSERMLQALENGVKGGKWFSLIDKVWNLANLSAAWMKAWANGGSAGVDGQSIGQFTGSLSQQLERLHQELKTGQYQPQPVRRHWIPKPGSTEQRPLGIVALALIHQWAAENGLVVHPTKTRIVDATRKGGFDFLGYHFERGMKWPRKKSLEKFKETIRQQTHRKQGQSIGQVIAGLTPLLRGWFEYFKHSQPSTFSELDSWIRGRLRSILRKHQGKKGRARGSDHQGWPNAYFDRLGFYSLVKARAMVLQSR